MFLFKFGHSSFQLCQGVSVSYQKKWMIHCQILLGASYLLELLLTIVSLLLLPISIRMVIIVIAKVATVA